MPAGSIKKSFRFLTSSSSPSMLIPSVSATPSTQCKLWHRSFLVWGLERGYPYLPKPLIVQRSTTEKQLIGGKVGAAAETRRTAGRVCRDA
jgi:hypothetical protein